MIWLLVAVIVASTAWLRRAPDGSVSAEVAAVVLLVAVLGIPLWAWAG